MNISTFVFGDYEEVRAKDTLADIGAIISYTSYTDIQLREIFHEFLFNQHFEVAAEIFDGINSINQKKKIILGLADRLVNGDLNLKLRDFFKKYDSVSKRRNDLAHGYLSPFREINTTTIKEYHIIKPGKEYFKEPIKASEIQKIKADSFQLANLAFLIREEVTIFMKLNGSKLVKGGY